MTTATLSDESLINGQQIVDAVIVAANDVMDLTDAECTAFATYVYEPGTTIYRIVDGLMEALCVWLAVPPLRMKATGAHTYYPAGMRLLRNRRELALRVGALEKSVVPVGVLQQVRPLVAMLAIVPLGLDVPRAGLVLREWCIATCDYRAALAQGAHEAAALDTLYHARLHILRPWAAPAPVPAPVAVVVASPPPPAHDIPAAMLPMEPLATPVRSPLAATLAAATATVLASPEGTLPLASPAAPTPAAASPLDIALQLAPPTPAPTPPANAKPLARPPPRTPPPTVSPGSRRGAASPRSGIKSPASAPRAALAPRVGPAATRERKRVDRTPALRPRGEKGAGRAGAKAARVAKGKRDGPPPPAQPHPVRTNRAPLSPLRDDVETTPRGDGAVGGSPHHAVVYPPVPAPLYGDDVSFSPPPLPNPALRSPVPFPQQGAGVADGGLTPVPAPPALHMDPHGLSPAPREVPLAAVSPRADVGHAPGVMASPSRDMAPVADASAEAVPVTIPRTWLTLMDLDRYEPHFHRVPGVDHVLTADDTVLSGLPVGARRKLLAYASGQLRPQLP